MPCLSQKELFRMNRKFPLMACATLLLVFAARPVFSASGPGDATSSLDEATRKALAAVAGAGTMETHTYQYLQELSDDVGARVTGSPEAAAWIAWGAGKMKAIGLENVHTESWQLFRGWTRISADAEIVSPLHRRVMVDSLGWVGSTAPGGVEAQIVEVNSYDIENEMKDNAANWRGKVLLVIHKGPPPSNGMVAFAKFGDFLKAAHSAGAVAVIGGQGGGKSAGMHLTHTGILGFDAFYEIPVVSMAAEDQDQIERYMERGIAVRLKINVQNRVSPGPVNSANVVGEIRGTEHPEQIIVVGGHLDSWDLATGSTDNGCGTSTTLGAAEAIMKSGYKPRRTIRFVLFTGEEQGLLGSLAYAKTHQAELANHVAAVILDNGQGLVVGLNLGGRADLIPVAKDFVKNLQGFGDLAVGDKAVFAPAPGPFTIAGLPGINLDQDSPEYKYTHHSGVDTYDKIKPDILMRDTPVMALVAFWIADRSERLASPWPPEKTARMLIEKKQDALLKRFGIWPFGDLGSEPEKK